MEVEKRIQEGRPRFWFVGKPQQQEQQQRDDEPTQEHDDDDHIEEVDPQEIQTEKMMWLAENVSTLERENQELKRLKK